MLSQGDKDNINKFRKLKKSEKKIVGYLETIPTDYLAFIHGLLSAVFVKDLLDLTRKRIMDSVPDFLLSFGNILLTGFACFFILRLFVLYKELQIIFTSKPTLTGRYNVIFTRFEKTQPIIVSMPRYLTWFKLLFCIYVLLNTLYFVYINNYLFLLLTHLFLILAHFFVHFLYLFVHYYFFFLLQ